MYDNFHIFKWKHASRVIFRDASLKNLKNHFQRLQNYLFFTNGLQIKYYINKNITIKSFVKNVIIGHGQILNIINPDIWTKKNISRIFFCDNGFYTIERIM